MYSRRSIIVGGTTLVTGLLAGCATGGTIGGTTSETASGTPGAPSRFVSVDGLHFRRDGKPYRYAGANLWYGAWLGADTAYGNRARLARELDRLQALGIRNLRIIGSAEESPLKNSITPGFRGPGNTYNEDLLKGLDWTLAEMAKRDMTAVIYLANFWEWSGGMMTYLSWVNGGKFINMNDPAHPWPEFPDWNAAFYANAQAQALLRDYIKAVVTRTNTVTGKPYADDATIMAWQLANEPRPGGSDKVALPNLPNFYRWIDQTARYIKSLDGRHLVTTGSEGLKGSLEREEVVLDAHRSPAIDYMTTHIWPNNWTWMDAGDLAGTYAGGEAKVADYIAAHVRLAKQLGKPLVIEEFGYPRDGKTAYAPSDTTVFKDRFYRQIYAAVEADVAAGGPLAGSNFWAWNGEARTPHADFRFVRNDLGYMGDPPHEPQGWYGVFDSDAGTQAVIKTHAEALAAVR